MFYLVAPDLMAVPVNPAGQTFVAGNPVKLFDRSRYFDGITYRTYDVSPDGQKFLMVKDVGSSDDKAAPPSMTVVEHWFEELKQKLPAK